MTEHDRRSEEGARPRVRVTDKRRVHVQDGGSGPSGGSEPSASREAKERNPVSPGEGADEGAPRGDGTAGPVAGSELAQARREAAEYLEHLQRLKAEFDNYRKRVLKEQTRAVEMASEPLVRKLLEVLDEFDLALMAAEQRPDFDRFLHGVELVYAKLKEILGSQGLERIEAKGKPFDPELHEALMQSGEAEGEALVADVLRQGYTLKGRVIRPAGVKVVRR